MKPGNIAMISLNGYLDYSRLGAAKCEARRRQPGNIAMISLNGYLDYSRLGAAKCEARRRQPGNTAKPRFRLGKPVAQQMD